MILLVEDDSTFAEEVSGFFRNNSLDIEIVVSKKEALKKLKIQFYDLCLWGLDLPDCSGVELCKEIRKFYRNPIIIFSTREKEEDIVKALMNGADDYLIKPCSPRILYSKVFSQLRRIEWSKKSKIKYLKTGNLTIDYVHSTIFDYGKELSVKDTEFRLCYILIQNNGCIMPRKLLVEQLWEDRERFVEDNTLSVHISKLRKKLGTYQKKSYIETIKGVGYRWNLPVEKEYDL